MGKCAGFREYLCILKILKIKPEYFGFCNGKKVYCASFANVTFFSVKKQKKTWNLTSYIPE